MNKDIPYKVASGLCLYEAHMRQEQGIHSVRDDCELHGTENRGLIIAVCNNGEQKFESLYKSGFILDELDIWRGVNDEKIKDEETLFNRILAEETEDYALLVDIKSDVVGMVPSFFPEKKSRKEVLAKIPPSIAQSKYKVGKRTDTAVSAAEIPEIEYVVIKRQRPYNNLGGSAMRVGKNGVERISYLKYSNGELSSHDVDIKQECNDWNFLETGEMDLRNYIPKKVDAGIAVGANPVACKLDLTYTKPPVTEQTVNPLPLGVPAMELVLDAAQQVKKAS